MSLPVNLAGHTYGFLKVKRFDGGSLRPSAAGFWIGDCKRCGKKNVRVRGHDLRMGKIKSCG
jgi:hypothetical protein